MVAKALKFKVFNSFNRVINMNICSLRANIFH